MYKNQTRGRQVYTALGGRIGIIAIVIIAIIIVAVLIYYIQKRIREAQEDADDFKRYMKLIKQYLKTMRETKNYSEETVQFNMDRFQFSSELLPVGDAVKDLRWDNDSSTFGDLCNELQAMTSFASDKTSKFYRDELLWKQILFAIRTIAAKLPDVPRDYTMPWGTNWYQFSITYPTFLVATAFSYVETFGREEPFLTRHLSSYIRNYFKESSSVDGIYSLGWLRYESNVIGISVPVIGGRLYSNRFDSQANSQKYCRLYLAAEYVYQDNGFYYDNTYITHISRNDGYTTSFYHEFLFVYTFYRMKTRFFTVLHKNFSILEHPDIPLHHGPWFTRTGGRGAFKPGRKFAKYGVDIRGFERSICVRTKQIGLFYNGQLIPLASYESDRTNKEWGQLWIFMRCPITAKSSPVFYPQLVPYYDGVHSYGLKQIDWPSTSTTTTVFPPLAALCSLCYIQDRAAGMYNKYRITMASTYKFDVEEINLATPTGFHVFYRCVVDMLTAATNPYSIAVRLGNLDENQKGRLTGVGAKHSYAFDNFIGTFLYLDEIDDQNSTNVIKIDSILNPHDSEKLDALYFQPTQRQIFTFGFSNNFYEEGSERRHNNLIAVPTMNEIVTDDFKLEKFDTDDAMLMLHDYKQKITTISYAFNNVLPKGIRIKKATLDERFSAYTVDSGILDANTNEYVINTYEKQYQILLRNVEFK